MDTPKPTNEELINAIDVVTKQNDIDLEFRFNKAMEYRRRMDEILNRSPFSNCRTRRNIAIAQEIKELEDAYYGNNTTENG